MSRRDLERYAGLFAERTRGMKSSAMRDLMAITERPEVISLAGGLPDTASRLSRAYAVCAPVGEHTAHVVVGWVSAARSGRR